MKNVNNIKINDIVKRITYNKLNEDKYITFMNNLTSRNKDFILKLIDEHPFFFNFLKQTIDLYDEGSSLLDKFLYYSQLYYEDFNGEYDDDGNPEEIYEDTNYWSLAQNLTKNILKDFNDNGDTSRKIYRLFLDDVFDLSFYGLIETSEFFEEENNINEFYITPKLLLITYVYSEIFSKNEYLEYIDDVSLKLCMKKLMESNLQN